MIDWKPYVDVFDLIKGKNDDGGDSLQRFGTYYAVSKWLGHFSDWRGWKLHKGYARDIKQFMCGDGKYKRHPSRINWYGDCDRMSRDQATPLVISLIVFGYKKMLREFLWAHIKRIGFFTNTRNNGATAKNHKTLYKIKDDGGKIYWNYNWKVPDFSGPEFWGLYIRGLGLWWLYPVLLLSDLETLAGSIKRDRQALGEDDDVLNHMIISYYIQTKYWTPFSWGVKKVNNNKALLTKLSIYCRRVDLPLDELWRQLLTKG